MNTVLLEHHLDRALERMGGLYRLTDLLDAIASGRMQSFALDPSWVVTEISVFPRRRLVNIVLAVGQIEQLRILHDRVLAFAEEQACDGVQAYGREGWVPDAKREGWKIVSRGCLYRRV